MGETVQNGRIGRCWEACWHRARRPVQGVLVSEELAAGIAEQAIRNVSLDYDKYPGEAEFTARALEETDRGTKEMVARIRREKNDPQIHHDPEDKRYERNLDLDRLQRVEPGGNFNDDEWTRLEQLLRPLAISILSRRGIYTHDAEDLYYESLAELARGRGEAGKAPILDPTVFEEIIPLQARILSFRALDWQRRRMSGKGQVNQGEQLDSLRGDDLEGFDMPDPAADPTTPSFERIYNQCREDLSPAEWHLVFVVFVSQSATVQELIEDPDICRSFELKMSESASTRRRRLNEVIEGALGKIRKNLLI